MYGLVRTEIISTLVVAIPKSYRWPMGDEGKQARKFGGVSGPPSYPSASGGAAQSASIFIDSFKQ